MDREEIGAWLRLLESPGVGRESARRLLSAYGSPGAIFAASPASLRKLLSAPQASALLAPPEHWDRLLQDTWSWLHAAANAPHSLLTLGDSDYPQALLQTPDPPLLLYLKGRRELLGSPALAVVGSRNPTPQGRDNAVAFARHLSESGLCIVSGMASGIDGAAHLGALEGIGGTIAVVGTGLDSVYPKSHAKLAQHIARDGLLISEYALGAPALAQHFPLRNRLIAGLTQGTLVVEAALQSGSLITARLAAEYGREVFAIPGSIHAPQSRGCHQLIQQGAKLVTCAQDILEELRPDQWPAPAGTSGHSSVQDELGEDPLLSALGYEPTSLDELTARTGESAARLSAQLLELELNGQVQRLPGQLFQRRARA